MELPTLVWHAQKKDETQLTDISALRTRYGIRSTSRHDELIQEVRSSRPVAVCFEFFRPNSNVLRDIQSIVRTFPSISLIMVTETRSVSLAIWALRNRIWDYLIKPVETARLADSISRILRPTSAEHTPSEFDYSESQQNDSFAATKVNSRVVERIQMAVHFVETHFSHEFTQSEVAKMLAMSNSHFSRTFHKVTGMNFCRYVSRTRIRVATDLLRNRSLPITTICFESGFRDPAYFSRVFHQETGMSPSEYRKRHAGYPSEPQGLFSGHGLDMTT